MFNYILLICIVTVVAQGRGRSKRNKFKRIRGVRRGGGFFVEGRRNRATDEAIPVQQQLLNEAASKFHAINNGYYQFQVQKSCFCPVCSLQAMNINVDDNIATESAFAEGNDYALSNFCFNDNGIYDERLKDTQITIDDLFITIQAAITENTNIAVTYHELIGIPLAISIDPNDETADDETFISINCFQFNPDFPSPVAADSNSRGRGGRNKRNRHVALTTITQFNEDDQYSCSNIEVPSQCSNDYFPCFRYSDGCNTCSCDPNGNVISCTKRVCDVDIIQEPRCVDCLANTEWTTCGNDPQCIPDCNSPDNFCGIGQAEATICHSARCECPSSKPRWDGTQCITSSECGIPDDDRTGDTGLELLTFCVSHCIKYSDGCLTCQCDEGGNIIGECIEESTCSFDNRACIECEDPETMEYTDCGSTDTLCENVNTFHLNTQCIERCQCKPEYPIYDPLNKRCITAAQCKVDGIDGNDGGNTDAPDIETTDNNNNGNTDNGTPQTSDNGNNGNTDNGTPQTSDNGGFGPDPFQPSPRTSNCIEHCPVYFNGCNACQCPDIIANLIESGGDSGDFDDGADFCTNLVCPQGVEGGSTRTCFRCELTEMEYTKCGQCDRTCIDPSPICLNWDGCIEKCQCPLDAPIYDNGRCITVEQCGTITGNGRVSGRASAIQSNQKNGLTEEEELDIVSDTNTNNENEYGWPFYVLYIMVAVICIIAGLLLLLWPKCMKRMRKKQKMNGIKDINNDESDDDMNGMNDIDDVINVNEIDATLSFKPDGTVVNNNNDNNNNQLLP